MSASAISMALCNEMVGLDGRLFLVLSFAGGVVGCGDGVIGWCGG